MENNVLNNIKYFLLKHMKFIAIFSFALLIGVILILFKVSYSSRYENSHDFDEIQKYLRKIERKDMFIYNDLQVKEINKTVKGIDVSSFQGDIDWEKVKNSGIDFVMIRCGFRSLVNSDITEDSKFRYNIKEANRLNIPVGIYFYSTAINEVEAIEEATFVLNLIKNYKVTYPVVYDFESFNKNRTQDIDYKQINNNAIKFLDYLEKHGYKGMIYSNLKDLSNYWELDRFKKYKFWYAQYIDEATYEGSYDMWQYADNGRIDGIVGKVDLNESYISYEEIK